MNRKSIYNIIEPSKGSMMSRIYDVFMVILIFCSIIPLMFRNTAIPVLAALDKISVSFFILDYLLRWCTADYAFPDKKKWQAFILYPFTGFAIIDLLSIIPSFNLISKAWKVLRIARLIKILRVFKFVRYSKNIQLLFRVLHKEKSILLAVMCIAVAYIFTTALIMFNCEDTEMFTNYFDALYWATTTLTTVGYGDICPQTTIGRIISMFSALMGVAIIALPSGVITASYMDELKHKKQYEPTSNSSYSTANQE